MTTEAEVKRIGGSTFVRLPPSLAKDLDLHSGDHVFIDIHRAGVPVERLADLRGIAKDLPPPPDEDMWDA